MTNRAPANGSEMAEDELERSDRAGRRDSLLLMAQMTLGDETSPRDVRVRNISEGGLMAELPISVEIGTAVSLNLRGVGAVSGRIAWCTQGRVGVAFDRQIDPTLVRKPVGGGASTPEYAKPATGLKTKPFHH
ncbi:PilZ domain-containing protein [Sphingomonas yabuuchiae]|uniref:PilZ domain-containing protein n=3 Tax=Sphingomonadaceae TaxID=41297 RepID=A0AA40ZZR4_9SPHN|nr:PilZ domain-containing protein [Sphingomonas yabuuchiae]MBN3557363.1 PilZ domain-containing protein [Sphingomonas yabuuchiae]